MTPQERSREIVDFLSQMTDKDERLQFVIDKGKTEAALEPQFRTDTYRIEGCVSNLWLVCEHRAGRIYFRADADAVITKGIAAILVEVYSDATPAEILALDPAFLAEAGITQHLTPNRRNGLTQVCAKIRAFAQSAA